MTARLLAGTVCLLWASAAAADIVIAVAGPMTGESAVFGEQMKQGAEIATADINAAGGVLGQRLTLDVEDDACDPKQAVAVANRIATKGIRFVVGHYCSSCSIAASKVYTEEGVLEMAISIAARYTDEGSWNTFRPSAREEAFGAFAGQMIASEFPDAKVAILHDNSAYGRGLADQVRGTLRADGKNEDFFDSFTPSDNDYTALISRLKQAKITVVYVGGYYRPIGLMLRQAREQGFDAQFVGGSALQTQALWDVGGAAVEGFRYTFLQDFRVAPEASGVVKTLRAKSFEPEGITLSAYAVVQMYAAAVAKSGSTDARTVGATLKSGGPWSTVLGKVAFNQKGDWIDPPIAWFVWRDGKNGPM